MYRCIRLYLSCTWNGCRLSNYCRRSPCSWFLGHSLPFDNLDSREVITRWREGEPLAREVMEETIAALGAAIASFIHIFNPKVIVIRGGVAEAGELYLNLLIK
ncbi:ROK family protein [Paenibacillus pseudetheri]|uniref:ROK family protein n=1 Tax=Paenibacillus pseudetheri TaxID=2897682 RepID=UPI00311AB454